MKKKDTNKNPVKEKSKTGKAKPKRKAKNEFRYNKSTKHPNYIFEEQGNKYRSVGITGDNETFGKTNMPLKKNPQKGKTKDAYIRNGIISGKKNNYGDRVLKSFSFDSEDMKNVKSKIRNYKKRRQKRHKKKTND